MTAKKIYKLKIECGIICLYKGVKQDNPNSVILIEQGKVGKSIVMFEDPVVKPLI